MSVCVSICITGIRWLYALWHKVKPDECLCDQLTHREANTTVMSVSLNAAPELNIVNDDQTQTNIYTRPQLKRLAYIRQTLGNFTKSNIFVTFQMLKQGNIDTVVTEQYHNFHSTTFNQDDPPPSHAMYEFIMPLFQIMEFPAPLKSLPSTPGSDLQNSHNFFMMTPPWPQCWGWQYF